MTGDFNGAGGLRIEWRAWEPDSDDKELKLYEGFSHELLNEPPAAASASRTTSSPGSR
jgi:alpha-beta hydrolase superfamily lysophospholipase